MENCQGSVCPSFLFVHVLLAKAQTARKAATALGKRPVAVAATPWRMATWKVERRPPTEPWTLVKTRAH